MFTILNRLRGTYSITSKPTEAQLRDQEGAKNGTHYLANLVAPMNSNYYTYYIVALLIRGICWFGLTLLPLVAFGYMNIQIYVLMTASLGTGFPLSVVMADGLVANNGGSGAEIIYGLIQDIVLLSFVWIILIW